MRGEAGRRFARTHHPCSFRSHGRYRRFSKRHLLSAGARAFKVGMGDVAPPAFPLADGCNRPGDILRAVDLARQGRLVCVDGGRENVLPGIDLHAAFDSHTWGAMFVNVRVDGQQPIKDAYILTGDLIYSYANLEGADPKDPQYVPIGLASGSQTNLLLSSDKMLQLVG